MPETALPEYSADTITYLEGLDAVRKRPGMYIGSTDSRGLQHLLWELIDNSVDEALAGYCTHIDVVFSDDGSVTVTDNGRGVPVDINTKTGMSGVELVFTKLHAGGKFGGSGYKVSGGLHGVGASVVNALSERLDVSVTRDSAVWNISFSRGHPGVFDPAGVFTEQTGLRKHSEAPPGDTGSSVTYWPDPQIFIAEAVLDLAATHTRARQTAFLVPGLTIAVTDRRGTTPSTEQFCFDGGTVDFVEYLAADQPVTDPIRLTGTGAYTETVPVLDNDQMVSVDMDREMLVDVALLWGTGFDTAVKSFVNIVSTRKGGTHTTGFERALAKTVSTALAATKIQKTGDEPVSKEDTLEGLTAIVTVQIVEPQFEGQTKAVLGTPAASKIVANVVTQQLTEWFGTATNRRAARRVLEKVAAAARTRRQLRLQRETIRRKNVIESSSLPAKLSDCRSSNLEQTELFILEGDSAGGTMKAARDSEFQALIPIRGKILNTLRASEKQMLDNAECAAIISALGAGAGKTFDPDQIRYGKVVMLCDADVDGAHIRCLLLTLFWRYMRPLLDEGRIYAAVPPLHRIALAGPGNELFYTYTAEEMEAKVAELETANRKIRDIQRYKGIGEMDADQLAETTIDPSRRLLRRMSLTDAEAADDAFNDLMGAAVAPRREFIMSNASTVSSDDLDF